MGCFTVLKKKYGHTATNIKLFNAQEHSITRLPEPQIQTRALQSAPPSFRTRAKPIQPINKITNSRTRTMSAPSSLSAEEQDALSSIEFEEQQKESKSIIIGLVKEHRSPSPQPLPLPLPSPTQIQSGSVLRTMWSLKSATSSGGSFKLATSSGPLNTSGPLPRPPYGTLRNFSYDELAAACHNFSPERCMSEGLSSMIYRASFGDDYSSSKKQLEATVTRLPPTLGLREFVNEVNTIASLQHPNLCKLIGFHARDGSEQRMLVYERLYHGSLDRLLYGRSDGPTIDWNGRLKVALCAAHGLTFLHEEGPFQAMFNEFSTANLQIDKDFSAKLSGYGCVNRIPETEIRNSSVALANVSVETLERGVLTPKSNVWCFGIVLLELLTGRRNLDSRHPKEERNLVKWSRPFLADDCRLSLIMDAQLKGRFPAKAARTVADITQRCLHMDPSERPTMRIVMEHLKSIQDMKYSCLFQLQEPGKHMSRSSSLNGRIIMPLSQSPPPLITQRPMSTHPLTCSSILSLEGIDRQESQKSSLLMVQRESVQGF